MHAIASKEGQSCFTMRMSDPMEEEGFLRQRAGSLARSAFNVGIVTLLLTLISAVWGVAQILSGRRHIWPEVVFVSFFVWIFVGTVLAVCFGCKCFLQRMSSPSREILIATLATLLTLAVPLSDPRYYRALFQVDGAPQCVTCAEDTWTAYTLLVLANITAILHVTLPIRWYVLVVQEVATMLVYTSCELMIGSIKNKVQNIALLFGLVFFTAKGKWQLERAERAMFCTLVAERTLRVKAEFKLPADDAMPQRAGVDTQSVLSTTPTGVAFQQLGQDIREENLATVAEIGRAEQWLVRDEELQLIPSLLLGRGGFGVVVAGLLFSSPVAVKLAFRAEGGRSLASLGNELRVLRKLRHPNLCGMHGACFSFDTGDIALVMELVKGKLLSKYLGPGGECPDAAARAQCLIGVCCALMYLHSRSPGIVHSDVKPSNIMVEKCHEMRGSGSIYPVVGMAAVNTKLLDFGLARVRTRRANKGGGTYRWAAPEAFVAKKMPPLPAADVYSFGCLIFFAATDEPPLASWHDRSIREAKRKGTPILLGFTGKLLLEQSWPQIEHATAHRLESRPTMVALHQQLMLWPECQEAIVSTGVDADLMRSTLLEQPNARGFWQEVQHLRQSLAVVSDPLALDVQLQQQQQQQPEKPQQQQQQPPMTFSSSSGEAFRLANPVFAETPFATVVLAVLNALCMVNDRVPRTACCSTHGKIHSLQAVIQALPKLPCSSAAAPSDDAHQCQACFGISLEDVGWCLVCGEGLNASSQFPTQNPLSSL